MAARKAKWLKRPAGAARARRRSAPGTGTSGSRAPSYGSSAAPVSAPARCSRPAFKKREKEATTVMIEAAQEGVCSSNDASNAETRKQTWRLETFLPMQAPRRGTGELRRGALRRRTHVAEGKVDELIKELLLGDNLPERAVRYREYALEGLQRGRGGARCHSEPKPLTEAPAESGAHRQRGRPVAGRGRTSSVSC